jgi:phytoene dehydrogenase-like protein
VTGTQKSHVAKAHDKMHDVVIVGAGLAGLTAARLLIQAGLDVVVLEADDRPGGRLKTDRVDGFLLDHGFQVYLTGYQTAGEILNLKSLNLRSFEPGAMVRVGNTWHTVKDPLRSPWNRMPSDAIKTLLAPIATWEDLWTLFRYRQNLMRMSPKEVLERPSVNTLDRLRQVGFSERIIDRFFRPFLGGIFLDSSLNIASPRMEFVFREMGLGTASLPEAGIQAIPESLCRDWKPNVLRLSATVAERIEGGVKLSDGQEVRGRYVVIATEASGAKRLLGDRLEIADKPTWNATTCLYFSMDRSASPTCEPILFLNGNLAASKTPAVVAVANEFSINHVAFPSLVQPAYAPHGQVLASVNINGSVETQGHELVHQVRIELERWFGWTVSTWRHLRTYSVPCAFTSPSQAMLPPETQGLLAFGEGLFACGDYTMTASIEGAMQSGRLAANAILHRKRDLA